MIKEPGVFKMTANGRCAALILLAGILGFQLAASAAYGRQENLSPKTDYEALRQEILQFEGIINDTINRSFSSSPFAIVQKAKGVYLQGYGASFAFLVNIHRAVKQTPFGPVRSRTEMTQDLKKQRIEELKERLIQALQDNGEIFRTLRKEDYVTIIAYVEDRNLPDEPSANRTIVMSALKKDLDEFAHMGDRNREFKQRMKIVEY